MLHNSSAKLIPSPAHLALGEGVPGVGADAGLAVPLAARKVHQVQLGLADVLAAQGVVVDNLRTYVDPAFCKYILYLLDSAPGGRR